MKLVSSSRKKGVLLINFYRYARLADLTCLFARKDKICTNTTKKIGLEGEHEIFTTHENFQKA